jgi:hypothetical protein
VVFRSKVKELQNTFTYLLLHANIIIKFHSKISFLTFRGLRVNHVAIRSDRGDTWREMAVPAWAVGVHVESSVREKLELHT